MNFGPKTKVTRSSKVLDPKTMRMIKRGRSGDQDQSPIVDYGGSDTSSEDGSRNQELRPEPLVRILASGNRTETGSGDLTKE